MKRIYFTILMLCISAMYALAQPQLLISSDYYKKSFAIKQGNKIVVYLKNKVVIDGKLNIENDSMITVDDTTIHLNTIDFVKIRVHNKNTMLAIGVTTAVCGLWPCTGLYFLYEYGIKPKRLLDIKNDCKITVVGKTYASKFNTNKVRKNVY
ncbi:MAG: hypothetical protein RIQ33_1865 [Bacteroidota bacterium]|jgi:hypothetical protein